MRVLIIGGTQFIGPAVVARLSGLGHELLVFHRGKTELYLGPAATHLHGDRQQLRDFAAELRQFDPHVVLDMSAFTERDAWALMSAIRGIARRVVVLSSQDVYRAYGRFHRMEQGARELAFFTEDSPLRRRLYPYRGTGRGLDDYEKILVEWAVMGNPDLPGTVLRLPMVYGERDYQHRIFVELKRMDDGRREIMLEETFAAWRWTRAYVENVAHAVALAVTDERAAGRVYNVGEADALPYADWLLAIGRAAGWKGELVVVPDGTLPPRLRPPDGDYAQHLVADTTRIRAELGYQEPVPRDTALRRTVDWERAHRPAVDPRWFDYAAEDALLAELRAARSGSATPIAPSATEAPRTPPDLPPPA